MASQMMTFTIPQDLASEFLKQVPARDRSRYVAEAIAAKLRERDEVLIRACEIANASTDVLAIEREWEALADEADAIAEPWDEAATR
jgi:hypothetical protein